MTEIHTYVYKSRVRADFIDKPFCAESFPVSVRFFENFRPYPQNNTNDDTKTERKSDRNVFPAFFSIAEKRLIVSTAFFSLSRFCVFSFLSRKSGVIFEPASFQSNSGGTSQMEWLCKISLGCFTIVVFGVRIYWGRLAPSGAHDNSFHPPSRVVFCSRGAQTVFKCSRTKAQKYTDVRSVKFSDDRCRICQKFRSFLQICVSQR